MGAVAHRFGQFDGDVGRQRAEAVEDFMSRTGVLPAAISTIIVSPTARPRPIITAENRPLMAVGMMMRMAVCQGVAPQPSDAERRCSGTATGRPRRWCK